MERSLLGFPCRTCMIWLAHTFFKAVLRLCLALIFFGRTTVQDVTVQDVTMRQGNYNIEVGNLGSPVPLCLAAFSSRKEFNFLGMRNFAF